MFPKLKPVCPAMLIVDEIHPPHLGQEPPKTKEAFSKRPSKFLGNEAVIPIVGRGQDSVVHIQACLPDPTHSSRTGFRAEKSPDYGGFATFVQWPISK